MGTLDRIHRRAVFGRRVEVLAGHLAAALPPDASVLDVGCGDGAVAAAVAQRRPDVTVSGIDVLVRPTTQIPVERFDGRRIPHPDGSFDAVTFVDVLHHTDDPEVLLGEAARVAAGSVVVKDHLREGRCAGATLRFMDWVGNASHGVALPYNYWERRRWDEAFTRLGLRVAAETTRLGLYPGPASLLFDRQLHVVWRLERSVDRSSSPA